MLGIIVRSALLDAYQAPVARKIGRHCDINFLGTPPARLALDRGDELANAGLRLDPCQRFLGDRGRSPGERDFGWIGLLSQRREQFACVGEDEARCGF